MTVTKAVVEAVIQRWVEPRLGRGLVMLSGQPMDEHPEAFLNINTDEDLLALEQRLSARSGGRYGPFGA